jgi:peroxiredoxin/Tfp pilus assembly protein PilF
MRANQQIAFLVTSLLLFSIAIGVSQLGRAQSENPDFQRSMRAASQLIRQNKYEEAIAEYKNAIRLSGAKDYAPYWGMAQAYNYLEDTQNTLKTCDQMLALAPNDAIRAQCRNLNGMALVKTGYADHSGFAKAVEQFRMALDLDPLYTRVHFYMGVILLLENHDAEGIAELKTFLASDPDGDEADEAQSYIGDPNHAREGPDSNDAGSNDVKTQQAKESSETDSKKPSPIVGTQATDFSFINSQGQRMNLRDLRGKVVLLDFWATWCPTCRRAMPGLKWISEQAHQSKFVMVSISDDENESVWRDFIASHHLDWTQAKDADGRFLTKIYPTGKRGIPDYFLIDADGIIRKHYVGWSEAQDLWLVAGINKWAKAQSASAPSASPSPAN